jgi:hypothetical protein
MPAPRTKAALLIENEQLRQKLATLPRLEFEYAQLQAQLEALQTSPEPFVALKAADHHGYHETTLLRWCERGLIEARREGSRWFSTKKQEPRHLQ